jgi:hypothetical protein
MAWLLNDNALDNDQVRQLSLLLSKEFKKSFLIHQATGNSMQVIALFDATSLIN